MYYEQKSVWLIADHFYRLCQLGLLVSVTCGLAECPKLTNEYFTCLAGRMQTSRMPVWHILIAQGSILRFFTPQGNTLYHARRSRLLHAKFTNPWTDGGAKTVKLNM